MLLPLFKIVGKRKFGLSEGFPQLSVPPETPFQVFINSEFLVRQMSSLLAWFLKNDSIMQQL